MPQIPSTMINGMRFYGSELMTTAHTTSEDVEQRRTWAARIFETPWRPFKATKTVTKYTTVYKPSREVIQYGDNFFAHPELIKEMVAAIDKVNESKP